MVGLRRTKRRLTATRPSGYSTGSSRNAATTAATTIVRPTSKKPRKPSSGAKGKFLNLEWAPAVAGRLRRVRLQVLGVMRDALPGGHLPVLQRVAGAMLLGRDVQVRLRGPEGRVPSSAGACPPGWCLTTPRASAEGRPGCQRRRHVFTRFAAHYGFDCPSAAPTLRPQGRLRGGNAVRAIQRNLFIPFPASTACPPQQADALRQVPG